MKVFLIAGVACLSIDAYSADVLEECKRLYKTRGPSCIFANNAKHIYWKNNYRVYNAKSYDELPDNISERENRKFVRPKKNIYAYDFIKFNKKHRLERCAILYPNELQSRIYTLKYDERCFIEISNSNKCCTFYPRMLTKVKQLIEVPKNKLENMVDSYSILERITYILFHKAIQELEQINETIQLVFDRDSHTEKIIKQSDIKLIEGTLKSNFDEVKNTTVCCYRNNGLEVNITRGKRL